MKSSASNIIDYENTLIRLITVRRIPMIRTAGISIKETPEGRELFLPYWIAKILVGEGLAHFAEESLSMDEWTQIHFRQRLNPMGPVASLPEDFYSRAHISLNQTSEEQLNRLRAWYRDILESRIVKLVRMAGSEAQSPTRAYEREELELYESLASIIRAWREDMRKLGEEE